jgi:hypothetical protein
MHFTLFRYLIVYVYFQSTLPGAAQSPVISFGGSYGGICSLFAYVYHCTKYECRKCCVMGSPLDASKFLLRSAQSC